jgi:site-specific DNA-methyltransferase (adenine-specific)
MLPEALDVMQAWGFEYKTTAFTWIKKTKNGKLAWGMGRYTRSNPEIILLGTKGKPLKVQNHGIHSVIEAPAQKHSVKPKEVQEKIVTLLGDRPRVELFAREIVPGWDAIGNEIDGQDIREILV